MSALYASTRTRVVARPGIRAAVPRTAWPNFRDARKTVDRPLLYLLVRLQRRYGRAYVAEAALRKMICEDTGHMPGMDTIRRALDRLAGRGLLYQEHLVKGGILPDGSTAYAGMREIRVALSHAERLRLMDRARRKEGRVRSVGMRVDHRQLIELMTIKRSVAPSDQPPAATSAVESNRQIALAWLATHARELEPPS